MECFLIKDGMEKKAELEDILPLIEDGHIPYIIRFCGNKNDFVLPLALAHIPGEIKELIYRNVSQRVRVRLEKDVKEVESTHQKDNWYLQNGKARMISFIGEFYKEKVLISCPKEIVFREAVTEKEEETPAEDPSNPVEELIKKIEEACNSGHLNHYYTLRTMSEEDVQKAFAVFENRLDELKHIRSLDIYAKDLPAAALLFKTGSIEELKIYGEFRGSWPLFLEECQTLRSIEIYMWDGLAEFPSWIRNAVSLSRLSYWDTNLTVVPDWIGDMQSLTELSFKNSQSLKSLPDSLGNLKNLVKLSFSGLAIEKLPDCIGDMQSLTELSLDYNQSLKSLPDCLGKLKNLVKLSLSVLAIERLPDWIGDLESLTELHISYSKKLKYIPDSLGKLKNLVKLDLFGLPIENLPDTIANCTSLEYVDICGTNISSVPNTISKVKTVRYSSIGLIPKEHYISYRSFCNCYYRLVEITLKFLEKARREGLLALEEDLETLNADFFKQGIRLVVDGTNAETIRHLMTLKIEREHGYYRKKLLETAMEGFLSIQSGTAETQAIFNLAALVDIKDNPIDAAISKYLAGDDEALEHIDFKSAILPEDECEEIRFIKRVTTMSIIFWAEGNLALEKHLNYDAIVAKDVFECGLLYIVDDWSVEEIDKNLSMLIALETNPVGRNLALAKKDAIRMIADGYPQRVFLETLLAYFDDSIIVEDLIDEFKLN